MMRMTEYIVSGKILTGVLTLNLSQSSNLDVLVWDSVIR